MFTMYEEIVKALTVAEGYRELKMWKAAWETLDALELRFRHHPNVLIGRIEILAPLTEWEKAGHIAKGLTEDYPQFADAWYWQAAIQCQTGDVEKARVSAQESIRLDGGLRERILNDRLLEQLWDSYLS